MPDEPEFSGEQFLKLSTDQRVRLCVRAAERAHHLANKAPESHKCFYLEIAQQWLLLADAILQESLGRSSFSHHSQ
jgi:hypothetical protein